MSDVGFVITDDNRHVWWSVPAPQTLVSSHHDLLRRTWCRGRSGRVQPEIFRTLDDVYGDEIVDNFRPPQPLNNRIVKRVVPMDY